MPFLSEATNIPNSIPADPGNPSSCFKMLCWQAASTSISTHTSVEQVPCAWSVTVLRRSTQHVHKRCIYIRRGETNFTGNIPFLIGTEITQNTPQNAGLSISILDSRVYLLSPVEKRIQDYCQSIEASTVTSQGSVWMCNFSSSKDSNFKKEKRIAQKAV